MPTTSNNYAPMKHVFINDGRDERTAEVPAYVVPLLRRRWAKNPIKPVVTDLGRFHEVPDVITEETRLRQLFSDELFDSAYPEGVEDGGFAAFYAKFTVEESRIPEGYGISRIPTHQGVKPEVKETAEAAEIRVLRERMEAQAPTLSPAEVDALRAELARVASERDRLAADLDAKTAPTDPASPGLSHKPAKSKQP